MKSKLEKAYSVENFREQGHELIDMIAHFLEDTETDRGLAIPWQHPEEQLKYWKQDFSKAPLDKTLNLLRDVMKRSVQVHRKRYLGHQTTPTLPVTVLSGAVMPLVNQGMGVYEMGMVGNTIEKIHTEDLAQQLGYSTEASGLVTSGGSLGNLTALLAARAAVTLGVKDLGKD